uniref:Uncharacterized protein n=1 Tax=Opuntia streptacantha TaxID=393608 RepID=A0A7C8YS92_OPUST
MSLEMVCKSEICVQTKGRRDTTGWRYIFGQRRRERSMGPVSVLMGRDKVGDLIWVVVFRADYISCVQLSSHEGWFILCYIDSKRFWCRKAIGIVSCCVSVYYISVACI